MISFRTEQSDKRRDDFTPFRIVKMKMHFELNFTLLKFARAPVASTEQFEFFSTWRWKMF